jgi:hypothetical protein
LSRGLSGCSEHALCAETTAIKVLAWPNAVEDLLALVVSVRHGWATSAAEGCQNRGRE